MSDVVWFRIIIIMKWRRHFIPRVMSCVEASLNLMDLTDSTVSEIQPMDDTCAIEIRINLSSLKKL